jgi:hypothetical protein
MKVKSTGVVQSANLPVDLGENPVNAFHAREYAKESSPGIVAVVLELTENARDNATEVSLTIDVAEFREEKGHRILIPNSISCEDNGTGLSHQEFLERFCGAYSESEAHHEIDRAGRNGVGTKTYTSISDRIEVRTTTGRPTEGLDQHRDILAAHAPAGLRLPRDGEPDSIWRVYDFRLHKRSALAAQWSKADAREMGTRVELQNLRPGTEVDYEVLVERLSYARDWLQNGAHRFTIQLTGNVPTSIGKSRRVELKPWSLPIKTWLVEAHGRSDEPLTLFDPTTKQTETIPPVSLSGVISFDFRVVGTNPDGEMQSLNEPALLLEICGALPYPPNLDGVQSTRTLPLLTFLGLEHASSIGAFCNAVSGWARVNSIELKASLRNNKSTLAMGPGSEEVQELRRYLHSIFRVLHRTWYNATRAGQDEAARDALKEAAEEVNLALKGANRNPFNLSGEIKKDRTADAAKQPPQPPARRHRWECGSCGRRWLADAGFSPKKCAEADATSGIRDGCGSSSIGLAKNQPRIGDCEIRIEQLGDARVSAVFQFEKHNKEDEDVPVVRVNLVGPRYVELRGTGSMSGQAQKRLKQYLVDVSLVAIAEYNAKAKGTDFSEELGDLYFNRMLRFTGIREYEAQVAKILEHTGRQSDLAMLAQA